MIESLDCEGDHPTGERGGVSPPVLHRVDSEVNAV